MKIGALRENSSISNGVNASYKDPVCLQSPETERDNPDHRLVSLDKSPAGGPWICAKGERTLPRKHHPGIGLCSRARLH